VIDIIRKGAQGEGGESDVKLIFGGVCTYCVCIQNRYQYKQNIKQRTIIVSVITLTRTKRYLLCLKYELLYSSMMNSIMNWFYMLTIHPYHVSYTPLPYRLDTENIYHHI